MPNRKGKHDLKSSGRRFPVHQTEYGNLRLDALFEDESVRLPRQIIAELLQTSVHICNIQDAGELSSEATVKKFLTVRSEVIREVKRSPNYCNLELIIPGTRTDRDRNQATILRFNGLKSSALRKLQPLGVEDIPDSDLPALLTSLKERLKRLQKRQRDKADLEKQISELDGNIKRLDAIIETRSAALTKKQEDLEKTRQEYNTANSNRRKLFGDKKPLRW